jgi:hypothetical protein
VRRLKPISRRHTGARVSAAVVVIWLLPLA